MLFIKHIIFTQNSILQSFSFHQSLTQFILKEGYPNSILKYKTSFCFFFYYYFSCGKLRWLLFAFVQQTSHLKNNNEQHTQNPLNLLLAASTWTRVIICNIQLYRFLILNMLNKIVYTIKNLARKYKTLSGIVSSSKWLWISDMFKASSILKATL